MRFLVVGLLLSSYAHAMAPSDCLRAWVTRASMSSEVAFSCTITCQALAASAIDAEYEKQELRACLGIETFKRVVGVTDPCAWIVSQAFTRPFDEGEKGLLLSCVANLKPGTFRQNPLIGPFR